MVSFPRRLTALAVFLFTLATAGESPAKAVTLGRTETRTDFVTAGLGGLSTGSGNFQVSGVAGPVRKAFLYWHGIDNTATGAVYDNETISFAGSPLTGTSLGDASTNCWGNGGSRAFFADVTARVTGNGSYSISGLNAKAGHSGNGASLIVLFSDGNESNDVDLVFFEGNDSNVVEIAGSDDANGWEAILPDIQYTGGSVFAQFHVADGQSFPDGVVEFAGESTLTIPDNTQLWDGHSVPSAGFSRAGSDGLWDIHTFDVTEAFGTPGSRTITLSGMINDTFDCHSLVALVLVLRAGSAPCGNGQIDGDEQCDPASAASRVCPDTQTCLNDCTCGCSDDFQCNDGNACTVDACDQETGTCVYGPAQEGTPCDDGADCTEVDECSGGTCRGLSTCPTAPGCTDTCDAFTDDCRECGRPVRNDRCIVNAVVVLQAALDLRACELCLCDVDSSGDVTATDALKILRGCAGIASDLQCPGIATTTTTTLP